LANIVGPRSAHGVIHDFIEKLRRDPRELEILGDGAQTKSYLHVSDCARAILLGLGGSKGRVEVYNVGSEDQVSVRAIARIVIEEMGLRGTELRFTGGVDGGRGWVGDVRNMLLDVGKLKALGWRQSCDSAEAVRRATREALGELARSPP
jgi:UDP-glucose 4-epimerase